MARRETQPRSRTMKTNRITTNRARSTCLLVSTVAAVLIAGSMQAANAATAATGDAHGVKADISLVGSASLGPVPAGANGSAPPDFAASAGVVSIDETLLAILDIDTGVVSANTQAALISQTASSSNSVTDPVVDLNTGISVLTLTADAVGASASVSCSGGTPQFSGGSTLTNLQVSLLGV